MSRRVLAGAALAAAAAAVVRNRGGATGYRDSLFWRLFDRVCARIDHERGWDKVSPPLGLADADRRAQRAAPAQPLRHERRARGRREPVPPFEARLLTARSADGTYNDLSDPAMGSGRARASAATSRSSAPSRSPSRRCRSRARASSAASC